MKTIIFLIGMLHLFFLVTAASAHATELTLEQVLDRVPQMNDDLPRPEDVVGVKVGE